MIWLAQRFTTTEMHPTAASAPQRVIEPIGRRVAPYPRLVIRRLLLVRLVLIMLALAGAGCQASGSPDADRRESQASLQKIDPRLLQFDLMNFSDRFTARMSDAYDQLADDATTAVAKDMALDCKIDGVMAAYGNAVDPNPIVGLMDMLIMVRLVRLSSEEASFKETFGEHATRIVTLLKVEEEDINRLGERYLTQSQLTEIREATDRWRQSHPNQRYVAMARISDFPEAAANGRSKQKGPGSVFGLLFLDPLSGLDPAVREFERSRETAERMFFYAQRMPLFISWGAEAASRRMLSAPQVQQFVTSSSGFSSTVTDSSKQVEALVKQLPQHIEEERQRTLKQLLQTTNEAREAAVKQLADVVAVERDAAIKQSADAIGVQRDAAVRQIAEALATEREQLLKSTTTSFAHERDVTIEQLNESVRIRSDGFARDLESAATRTIHRLFVYGVALVVLAIGLATLAVLMLRRGRERSSSALRGSDLALPRSPAPHG